MTTPEPRDVTPRASNVELERPRVQASGALFGIYSSGASCAHLPTLSRPAPSSG